MNEKEIYFGTVDICIGIDLCLSYLNPLQLQGLISLFVKKVYKTCKVHHLSNIFTTFELCTARVENSKVLIVYIIGIYKVLILAIESFYIS